MIDHEFAHCKDCCCARAWDALGVQEYTGLSIPEHITKLRAERDALRALLKVAQDCIYSLDAREIYADELARIDGALKDKP